MQIQCKCGQFQIELSNFPEQTPGRCICYCDDCQTYLHHIGRTDLLDEAGGTEIIPIYPSNIQFLSDAKKLKLTRLSPKGMFRFSTVCCNTPIANTSPKLPWAGFFHCTFKAKDPSLLEKLLGPVKSKVMARFAVKIPPPDASDKMSFRDGKAVLPFLLKGFLFGKSNPSPFFKEDGSPVVDGRTLSLDERKKIRDGIYKKSI